MLWNLFLHITVLNVKLATMRNCKEKDIVIWTLFGEKKGYKAVFDGSWVEHGINYCQITADSPDNFYCVPFCKVFIGCISGYCSLLLQPESLCGLPVLKVLCQHCVRASEARTFPQESYQM